MVEETNDSSCLNYKQIRHQFEEYDLSDLFETPKKNTTPKVSLCNINFPFPHSINSLYFQVHRCKTCRKVFSKASHLTTHRYPDALFTVNFY